MSSVSFNSSLTCETPQAFFLHRETSFVPRECISAQLTSGEGLASVLCAYFAFFPENNSYPAFAPFLPVWRHQSLLENVTQIARCPVNEVMQVVGLFAQNVSQAIGLNIRYQYGDECHTEVQNPPTYLDAKLAKPNTQFTLGISQNITACIPNRPSPLAPPHEELENYPLAAFVTQNKVASVVGENCQVYLLEKKSDHVGNFKITCLGNGAADANNTLDSNSSVGSIIQCEPYEFEGRDVSQATIEYTPGQELGEYDDTSVTVLREYFPCAVKPGKNLSADTIAGVVCIVLATVVVPMLLLCKRRYQEHQAGLHQNLVNYDNP